MLFFVPDGYILVSKMYTKSPFDPKNDTNYEKECKVATFSSKNKTFVSFYLTYYQEKKFRIIRLFLPVLKIFDKRQKEIL